MQTPKSRNSSSVSAPRKSSPRSISSLKNSPQAAASSEASKKVSPRVVRQLKTATSSPNTVTKASDHTSPKSRASQVIKSPSGVSELESQVSQLEKDLETVRNQLRDTEESKERAEKDAEEANRQVLALSLKFEESQKKLSEKLASSEISQEQEQKLKSDPEAVQDEKTEAVELRQLAKELSETLSLVEEDMKNQLRDSKEYEDHAKGTVDETLMHLANAKKMVDMLRSDGLKPAGDYDTVVSELKKSRARVDYLEGLVSKLEAKMMDTEMETEVSTEEKENSEVKNLRSALKAAEIRYAEEQARSAEDIKKAFEMVERIKSESGQREVELESELKRFKYTIEELKANLMDKETELQGICEENDGLTTKLEKSLSGQREGELQKELENVKALLLEKERELQKVTEELEKPNSQINGGEIVSDTDSMKVGYLMEEIDKSNKKMVRITEQLEASQAVNADMEAEMRRLKVQSLQWRKAAEAAAAMISAGANNNWQIAERTDSLHSPNSKKKKKKNLPYGDELDDDVLKKKNVNGLKRFWKKPYK